MKRIYLFAVVVTVSFALLQSAEAYPRGSSRAIASPPHFSAPSYHSAPSRSFSSAAAHYSAAARFQNRTYAQTAPRVSSAMALRNSVYLNRARFSGDRTAAFNSRGFSPSTARLAAGNRTVGARSRGLNREHVVAHYSANWQRHWDRKRDHFWHGHRCHFRNGFWFIYDPFLFYPYGYGFYPYGSYYGANYYDDGSYAAADYAPASDANQTEYEPASRVSDVQSALGREGYYDGAVDGKLGPGTEKALRRYQRARGLEVTGRIDRAVIEALQLR